MKSIIAEEKCCYFRSDECGGILEKHHCIHGTGWRKKADKYGLTVWLCSKHHRDSKIGVHGQNTKADLHLKRVAQTAFEAKYSHVKWMNVFGKNYL